MAKENKYADLSVEELNETLTSHAAQLQTIKFNHAVTPLENPMEIRELRRNIARINTELQNRKKQ